MSIKMVKIVRYEPVTKRCVGCGSYKVEFKQIWANRYWCSDCTEVCQGCGERGEKRLGGICDECQYEMAASEGRVG